MEEGGSWRVDNADRRNGRRETSIENIRRNEKRTEGGPTQERGKNLREEKEKKEKKEKKKEKKEKK